MYPFYHSMYIFADSDISDVSEIPNNQTGSDVAGCQV